MQWAVWCEDGENVAEARTSLSKAHSQHLNGAGIRLLIAGPLMSDDGKTKRGSLFVFEAGTRMEVEAHLASDPFNTAGVWVSTTISAFAMSRNRLTTNDVP